MRRRKVDKGLTAEQVAGIYADILATNTDSSPEVRRHALRVGLAEHGYSPADAMRAISWLRQGKPPGYRWDE